jgi:5-methyltetrahydrofolate--homocysteine methyltransferase
MTSAFLEALERRVLLFDGAMGTQIQGRELSVEADFWGQENCSEILNLSRPDLIREIHLGYLAAGADALETNSFGGSPVTLGEFELGERAFEINRRAAELAHEAIAEVTPDGRQRFVIGAIGPGTRLPSLGHIAYRTLEQAFSIQAAGLIAGGADVILCETCQDPLQAKAAINGARIAMREAGKSLPLMVQVTVETTGTLLVGTDIAAAATIIGALDVPIIGLNCATGPQEMAEHLAYLAESWPGPVSVLPNAGLPELVEGQTRYPLGPRELAGWLERFVTEDGVGIIGGCCGTTIEHIQALDQMLRGLAEDGYRPCPKARKVAAPAQLASLYSAVSLRQEQAYLSIGERCNANGSKAFRERQAAGDWDACVAIGRAQAKEGAHALDVCTAYVGRDESRDMTEVVSRLRGAVDSPLVFDSTELPVLETALELYGGKAVLNSINFEDGEEPPTKRMELARKFGAGVIALTIDETGMAKDVGRKLEIARRLVDFACDRHGLPRSDLLIDPLTFTICTGNEDDRGLGIATLDAIAAISAEFPDIQIILGLSNISFGLNPAARHVLNSVFLDEALKRGLTGAILHSSKIMALHKIPQDEVELALDLIFDRRREGYDPLHAFMARFAERKAASEKKERPAEVEARLKQRIIDGDRQGLEADLDEALGKYPPLDIINVHLLDGMKVVGDLFGSGQMQLPFVLQSAETMKAAVAYLEPHMERVEGSHKGTVVLATVKGDVHDIGKNLVDIILTNNGYKVVNLGIKQPLANILAACHEHKAHAIGMSGLLVKSTVIMRENMLEMSRQGLNVPVMLGGAALTRQYVEEDCVKAYDAGRVAYARDAFDGLHLMDRIMSGCFDTYLAERQAQQKARPKRAKPARTLAAVNGQAPALRPIEVEETRLRRNELSRGVEVPEPPFLGPRLIEAVPVRGLLPFLNDNMLYQFHWGFKKDGRTLADFLAWASKELKPILVDLVDEAEAEQVFQPRAVYGYWPAAAEGNDVILFDPVSHDREVARFSLPRQPKKNGLCIADFLRDATEPERDVLGLQVVTVGQRASEVAREWFAANRYNDYVRLHGLGVELAEAMAEYVHGRIRAELGFGHLDARDRHELLKQGYRGSRYSFGYPACPNLADQRQLLALLDAARIGIELSEEDQLHPEQSTSALVLHHPQARYFNV